MELISILFTAGVIIIPISIFLFSYFEKNEILSNIAKENNLEVIDSKVIGTIKNNNIEIYFTTSNKQTYVVINLTPINDSICFYLKKRGLFSNFFDEVYFTGDRDFDEQVIIETDNEMRTTGLLNNDVRSLIINCISDGQDFSISSDSIIFTKNEMNITVINSDLKKLLKLSNILTKETPTKELLMQNIQNEYTDDYKIKCLEYLVDVNINEISDFLENLLKDRNTSIVFLAAKTLGEKGVPALIELLKKQNYVEDAKEILSALKKYPNNPAVISIAVNSLKSNDHEKIACFINFLNEVNYDKVPDEILTLINNEDLLEQETQLCKEIIVYCGRLKIKDSISFLINKLKSKEKEIVLASLESLRLIDKIEFVEFILPLTKGFRPDDIKQKALKTIDFLQKDVSENLKGMLSVVEISSEDGNLSIADDDDESGKLSLEK